MNTTERFLEDLRKVLVDETTIEDVIKRIDVTVDALVTQLYQEGQIRITNDDRTAFMMMHDFVKMFKEDSEELCSTLFALVMAAKDEN